MLDLDRWLLLEVESNKGQRFSKDSPRYDIVSIAISARVRSYRVIRKNRKSIPLLFNGSCSNSQYHQRIVSTPLCQHISMNTYLCRAVTRRAHCRDTVNSESHTSPELIWNSFVTMHANISQIASNIFVLIFLINIIFILFPINISSPNSTIFTYINIKQ